MTQVRIAASGAMAAGPWCALLGVVTRQGMPALVVAVPARGGAVVETWPIVGRRIEIRGNGITGLELRGGGAG